MHLDIGHKIGKHYEIIEVLGQGGFGIVYKVKDTHLVKNNIFIIKELFIKNHSIRYRDKIKVGTPSKISDIFEKIKEDIIKEVDVLSLIENRNIVHAYGTIKENNTIYSIMEYIDGIDLEEYIKNNHFNEDMAMDLLEQLIHGLKEIHNKNIIHRDIKPSNIMRTKEGTYKIIDFTTNKTYSDKETTITALMSRGYSAPELEQRRAKIGTFTDIYSLGMTIYRILTKENPPAMADRFEDSYFQESIDDLNINSEFRTTIRKMTNIEVRDRFQNLEDIKEKLFIQNNETDKDIVEKNKNINILIEDKEKPKNKILSILLSIGTLILLIFIGFNIFIIIFQKNNENKAIEKKITKEDINEQIKIKIPSIKPKIRHWIDSDVFDLDNTLIIFKKNKIILTDENSFCYEYGNIWICTILNKIVNYKNIGNIGPKLRVQQFAKNITLTSDKLRQNTKIIIKLKKGYSVLDNKLVNENYILSFHQNKGE